MKVVGVVPKGSVLIHGRAVGEDRIPGLAKDIMPNLCLRHKHYIDDVVEVSGQRAIHMCKRLAREEGLFVGPSTAYFVMNCTCKVFDLMDYVDVYFGV